MNPIHAVQLLPALDEGGVERGLREDALARFSPAQIVDKTLAVCREVAGS